jgi:hypothetical protein
MDGADSQSAQSPDAHSTFSRRWFAKGRRPDGFGDGRIDSSPIVRRDEPPNGGRSAWLDGWSADTDHQTLHGSSWS